MCLIKLHSSMMQDDIHRSALEHLGPGCQNLMTRFHRVDMLQK
jgi:hypothetical protein